MGVSIGLAQSARHSHQNANRLRGKEIFLDKCRNVIANEINEWHNFFVELHEQFALPLLKFLRQGIAMYTNLTLRHCAGRALCLLVAEVLVACGGGSQSANQNGTPAAQLEVATGSTASTASTQSSTTSATTVVSTGTTATVGATPVAKVSLKGVNLSGAEYNSNAPAARLGWDYIYPNTAEIDYYHSKGFTAIRLPIAGSRVQPINSAPLNDIEIGHIKNIVAYCAKYNMSVILDPHDYGMKYDSISGAMLPLGMPGGLPAAAFADFWGRLAQAFKGTPNVVFGLMNEPHLQSATQWHAVASASITAIRASGAAQLILIPGTNYTGAHDWVSSGNATAWDTVDDPTGNFAFELHQYLDSDNSGTHAACVRGKGATVLADATSWARAKGYRLFLAEVAWSQDASCADEGSAIMHYTTSNADVWTGWTYWAGGPWIASNYIFMLDPAVLANPVDRSQMPVLIANL